MNRREHRARWLAHHRGEISALGVARARATSRPEFQDANQEARLAQGEPPVVRVDSHNASSLAKPAGSSLRLHIEEIVLHGFDPRGHYAVGDVFQQELARLISERGVPSTLGAIEESKTTERLDAGSFRAAQNSRPHTLGAQVAQAVYGGLKR